MPRKRLRVRGRKLRPTKKRTLFVIISCIVLAFGAVFYSKINNYFNPTCANSISCIENLSGEFEKDIGGIFLGSNLEAPKLAANNALTAVLGENNAEKHIEVDLTNQRLYAYQGDKVVLEFPVSTGKWGWTPTGEFRIWIKLLYTRMEGGSGNDYYNLPNVPYTMFFYNDKVPKSRGFALHGAYWHNNFGYPMSHGCINIRPSDAAMLYEWATPISESNTTYASADNLGTRITIYGEAPDF